MANIKPFRAIRPPRNKVSLVGSRSYINYSKKDFKEKLASNPYTFLHVITATYGLKEKKKKRPLAERYTAVREKFNQFHEEGIYFRDEQPAFYLYQQLKNGKIHSGIIAGVSVDDFNQGHVKKHEHTLTHRENIFAEYLRATRINAEPVLLTYKSLPEIEQLIGEVEKRRPEYEFSTTDKAVHHLWLIDHPDEIALLQKRFADVPELYIADGHHRCASSALLANELHKEMPSEAKQPYDYFMAFLVSDKQIAIHPYHRLVKDLNGLSEIEFLNRLEKDFTVTPSEKRVVPNQNLEIGMYLAGHWYRLDLKPSSIKRNDPVSKLDTFQLSDKLLAPVLGITDIKTDQRIGFFAGDQKLKGMEKMIDKGKYVVGFVLFPVLVDQLISIADKEMIMPPKSTWIEPKLRSGLTIYSIFDF